ncbi:glycoside hydrolase family 3 protein [Roridomyces roridus]|uniref:beta-glucosidase n=1 Tax=Roridomyces roridus TaxID=1738132 RepID=A0AAD7FVA3_9AGAR|nr:glycoside hydrolase family 3 protein [Roridomyces roridus]
MDIDQVFAKLSLPQKIKLLAGSGWWHTEEIPDIVPAIRLSDGPNGVRGTRFFNGVPASCFPSSSGLGSSFDVELASNVGKALADECRAKGVHVLLAPTVNTQRSPLGGRGFESFSEDPILNGTIAAAYINGLQSKGVSATIKHFVANDQEFERFSISSEVSERALREIYLKPFQIAVRDSKPWALMTCYNRVNGLHVSEDKRLIGDILRKEWGWEGMIMSDWIGVYSTAESIKAGLDLEMPGPTVMRGKAVERSLISQKLFPSDIDERVRKILELLKHAEESGIPFNAPEEYIDTPELRQFLRTAAADTIVLLKNDKKVLPLSDKVKSIAVIGPNAKVAWTSGGGSARLLSTYTVSPLEGIGKVAKNIGAEVKYAVGAASHSYLPLLDSYIQQHGSESPGALVEFWNEAPSEDFLAPDGQLSANKLSQCAWSTPTLGTNCFLMDGVDATKVNIDCFIRYSTKFTPDESGDWEFGMNVAGRGNLYFDNKLIVDLSTDPEQGESFFGLGTVDKQTLVTGLEAGRAYDLEIRISTSDFAARGSPFTCWGGIRLGGVRKFDGEKAIEEAAKLAKESDAVILVIGLNHDWESEGFDRKNIDLPGLTNPLVSAVLRANPNTVIVNQSGTPVAMPWINEAPTLVQAFYGGNELGNGIADVLWGKVNPSAKVSLTFPKRLEDTPAFPSFGDKGQELGKILYNEGIFVGYRSYEIRNLETMFPFGFGLSYSTFEYSDLQTSAVAADGTFSVAFTIKNTSNVAGREVAQVYISDPQASLPRPIKELRGFTKVALQADESKTVKVDLTREALSFYDHRQMCWVAEKGKFEVLVGASSQDILLKAEVELAGTITWTGL